MSFNFHDLQAIKKRLESFGQQHLFKFLDDLEDYKLKYSLLEQIENVEWDELMSIYNDQIVPQLDGFKPKPSAKIDESLLQGLPKSHVAGFSSSTDEELDSYKQIGLKAIKDGKVAALVLAGGQGTRLDSDDPKGMYRLTEPKGSEEPKTPFMMQAERIKQTRKLVASLYGTQIEPTIFWYIMTSQFTDHSTRSYFKENEYFGLDYEKVVFFKQDSYPCFSFDGKILLRHKHMLTKSPSGNGGLFDALNGRILKHMAENQVEFVHVFSVDNVLVRPVDPTFIGYCIEKGAGAGAKIVEKISPNESLGTICKVGDQIKVIEYSEISDEIANRRDPKTGKLLFGAGNICDHFFEVDFLKTICGDKKLRHHPAIKKIPCVSLETGEEVQPSEPNGIKLEKFIFDAFELAENFVAWEVVREDEFAPLKNAPGTERDNPSTALKALQRAYDLGLLKC